MLVVPDHRPSARIEGGYVIIWSGDEHLPINHQRVSLKRPDNTRLVQPFGIQTAHRAPMNLGKRTVALVAVVVAKSDPINRVVGCGPKPGRVHRGSGRYADPQEQAGRAQKFKKRLGHIITMIRACLQRFRIKLTLKRTYSQNMYQPSGWQKIGLPSPELIATVCATIDPTATSAINLFSAAPV